MWLIGKNKLVEELRELCRQDAENAGEFSILQRAIRIVHEQPTVDAEPQWIPCSERLPKMKEIVLITNDKGHVRCGQYRGVGFFSKNDERPHWNWKGNTLETVVAWMPLPKPYEVEDEKTD